jgi:adenylate kinase
MRRTAKAGSGKETEIRRRAKTSAPRRAGWVALTGTPGTGKTSSARRLPETLPAVEVSDIALRLEAGRRRGRGSVEVDLVGLRRKFRSFTRSTPDGVVIGHLAHLLPVSYVIVLRCNPLVLLRRLRRSRRTPKEQVANSLAETLDIVLVEALATGVPVREVDTTRLSPAQVARVVARIARRRPAARFGRVNWLADRHVTAELLRGAL